MSRFSRFSDCTGCCHPDVACRATATLARAANGKEGGFPGFFNDTGGLNPIAMGFVGQGPTFAEVRMIPPTNGSWHLNFVQATDGDGNSTNAFVNGTFSASAMAETPDPGTLGLMLVGSAGIWITRRRKKARDA